jgi:hypothetical protein
LRGLTTSGLTTTALALNSDSSVGEAGPHIRVSEFRKCLQEIGAVVLFQMRQDTLHGNARAPHHRLTNHDFGILGDAILVLFCFVCHVNTSVVHYLTGQTRKEGWPAGTDRTGAWRLAASANDDDGVAVVLEQLLAGRPM